MKLLTKYTDIIKNTKQDEVHSLSHLESGTTNLKGDIYSQEMSKTTASNIFAQEKTNYKTLS
jgi:hypothetical protein